MRSFKNVEPKFVEVTDDKLNIFQVRGGSHSREERGENVLTVRQPRRSDSGKYRVSWREVSANTRYLYKRAVMDWASYEPKNRVNQPLYHGDVPGTLPLVMEVDGKIVGFADLMFNYGSKFPSHGIPESDVGCSIALCILDKYQDCGFGSYFADASELIAKYMGAVWALGYTKVEGGMYNIRIKRKWEKVGLNGSYAIIRKNLLT